MTMKDIERKGVDEFSKSHSVKLDRLDKIAWVVIGLGIVAFVWVRFISPLDIVGLVLAIVYTVFGWLSSAFDSLINVSLKTIVIIGFVIVIGLLISINRKLR